MKKEALDLLRKYIDLQVALETRCLQAAAEDYYDVSIPWTRREIEETWKAFTDALGGPPVGKENEDGAEQGT